ncbi:MAG: hypothetical protein IKX24_01455 [Prevotella sp.]|jgi:hypothetical protein|nr:hypothetical protein [Prevotella sp.]MBR5060791.1 hypothetical protein [Prevotella sp.]
MKKLVFMFVAIAAISFASCGEQKPAQVAEEVVDSAAAVVDSLIDSAAVAVDSAIAQ